MNGLTLEYPFETSKVDYNPMDLIGSLDDEDKDAITEEVNLEKAPILG